MEEFDLFSNGTWIGDAERYPRMGEYIQVIKGLWTDPDFKGSVFGPRTCRGPP